MRRTWYDLLFTSVLALLVHSLAAPAVGAQVVAGSILQSDGVTPAAGVVLIVQRVRDSAVVARTVTGERGTFRVAVPVDSVTLTALRIGHLPTLLATLQLGAGARRTVRSTLPYSPVVVEAIRTRAGNRCQLRPDGARLVATLFAQARTALLASQLVSLDGAPRTRYRMRTEQRDRRERVELLRYDNRVSTAAQLFRSLPADSLAILGYATLEADGSTVYRSPDASVLVDDQFLSRHCLLLEPEHESNPDWIGVRFRPVDRERDRVEVEGVLWMDRRSAELRQLEYEYVGLSRIAERAKPGGWVNYTRLPNGLWFVHEYEIRMPRVASVVRRRLQAGGRSVLEPTGRELHLGSELSGGELLELSVDGQPRYMTGRTTRAATAAGDGGRKLPANLDLGSCGSGSALPEGVGLLRGVVEYRGGTRAVGARVTARWADADSATARTDASGLYTICNIPTGVLLQLRATVSERQTTAVAVRLSATEPIGVIPLTVPAGAAP